MATTDRAGEREDVTGGDRGEGLDQRGVIAFVAALLVPGAGHLLVGRWGRGALVGIVLLGTLALGLVLSGRVYMPGTTILSFLYGVGQAGLGLAYLVCLAGKAGAAIHAEQPTFEYGTTLILVSGLLNYLVALDAYDIAVGRKG